MAAVRCCWQPTGVEFAGELAQANRNVVLVAVRQNPLAVQYVAEALREDRGVIELLSLCDPNPPAPLQVLCWQVPDAAGNKAALQELHHQGC